MPIAERQVGAVTVIDLSGKLASSEESGKLKDKVSSVFFQGRKQVLVNLGGLTYMDSGGLGELVACLATAKRSGGAIKLANLGKRVQDLLIMTKLLAVFDVYDTEAEALTSFK
ncbi:MAG: anti-anti-sigma factor [Acidobacteria bacterium RIFCSPLOWO2_12_FULL_67_14b]|nr:MAG: anti-anti-sigma factor [Acidobacteria bacterium RIFCSPLOWO2_12_FULL_67_14b]